MKSILIFPFKAEEDNKKAFAFTLELARRSNANIIAISSLDINWKHLDGTENLEELISIRMDAIYCNILEMKGYYHGHFNQWKTFDDVEIDAIISENDINGTICSIIDEHENPIVVIHQKNFSGSGLCEEILSNPFLRETSIYLLPLDREFTEPSPDLIGTLFHNQKKYAFNKLLYDTKMFELPEDYHDFSQYMISQQVV